MRVATNTATDSRQARHYVRIAVQSLVHALVGCEQVGE